MKPWVYCTGFGPFPNVPINPTQIVMSDLSILDSPHMHICTRVLDVSFQRSTEQIDQDLLRFLNPPFAMIHFGVCRDSFIRLEIQAVNCIDSPTQDVDGVIRTSVPIVEHLPIDHMFKTSLDISPLLSILQKKGIPAYSSQDAGRYVCNRVYAHSLILQQQLIPQPISLFVHVPPIDTQHEGAGGFIWNRETLSRVCAQIIEWVILQSMPNVV